MNTNLDGNGAGGITPGLLAKYVADNVLGPATAAEVAAAAAAGSESAPGALELATNAETVTGTDPARAVHPAGLTARLAAPGAIGGTTPGAGTFAALTANGNTVLGDAAGDTVVMNAKSITKPNWPAVNAKNSAQDNDVSGDGTVYTIIFDSEIADRGSDYNNATGTFTAPTTGLYTLAAIVALLGLSGGASGVYIELTTSNRNYAVVLCTANATNQNFNFSLPCVDMDAGDTAIVRIVVSGGAKVVDVGVESYLMIKLEG